MQCSKALLFNILFIIALFVCGIGCLFLCKRIPNLNSQQLRICQQSPEIIAVIRNGIQLALLECERLFRFQPSAHPSWNCSSWIANSTNRLSVNISHNQVSGTKEAGFAYALFSAGVTFALSEACTRGNFSYCSCTRQPLAISFPPSNSENWLSIAFDGENNWKWNGCNHNVEYGIEMARNFLDSNEHQKVSIDSLLNLHNNLLGRKLIKEEMISKCQCHGYSGSCTVKTCWKTLNMFGQVTESLYSRYKRAKKVTFNWLLQSYRNKLNNRKHQLTFIGESKKNIITNRLEWLTKLEKQFLSITELEYNQPSLRRLSNENIKTSKTVKKRDLIYMRASYSYCDYANSTSGRMRRSTTDKIMNHNQPIDNTSTLSCSINHSHYMTNNQHQPHPEPCTSICCNRGYRLKKIFHTQHCQCKFHFCCKLDCTSQCTTSSIQFECL